jgi:hypothetical protein
MFCRNLCAVQHGTTRISAQTKRTTEHISLRTIGAFAVTCNVVSANRSAIRHLACDFPQAAIVFSYVIFKLDTRAANPSSERWPAHKFLQNISPVMFLRTLQANCQVAVSLSLANEAASLPVAYRLYLPKDWAADDDRRRKAGVPEEIEFKTKPEIALEHIRWACETGLPGEMVLIDAGYGHDSKLRAGITELGKVYVAGIQSQTLVSKPGRAAKKGHRDASNAISVKELAVRLRAKAWHTIEWREGTNERLSLRFARVRVHVGASNESENSAKEWLLIEWPEGEDEPTK